MTVERLERVPPAIPEFMVWSRLAVENRYKWDNHNNQRRLSNRLSKAASAPS